MASRRISPSDNDRPTKKPKIYRACTECKRRKVSCLGLTSMGCARCLTASKVCSLAVDSSTVAVTSPFEDMLLRKIQDLTERVEKVEAKQETSVETWTQDGQHQPPSQVSSQSAYIDRPSLSNPIQTPSQHPLLHPFLTQLETGTAAPSTTRAFGEHYFGIGASFVHPVTAGLISQDDMTGCYEVFKQRITSIIPTLIFPENNYDHPLQSSSGLIAFSILIYLDIHPMSEVLTYVFTSPPSQETILSLLILSHMPLNIEEEQMVSSASLIGMAYQKGLMLGLDKMCEVSCTEDMGQGHLQSCADTVMLWLLVQNRYTLLNYLNSRCGPITTQSSRFIQKIKITNNTPLSKIFIQIFIEAQILNEVGLWIEQLSEFENDWDLSEEKVRQWERLGMEMQEGFQRMSSKASEPHLLRIVHLLSFNLTLRFHLFFHSLPTPIARPIRVKGLKFTGQGLIKASRDLLVQVEEELLRNLPGYYTMTAVVALMTAKLSLLYVEVHHRGHQIFESGLVDRVEQKLLAYGGNAEGMIERLNRGIQGSSGLFGETQGDLPFGSGFEEFVRTFMNFDYDEEEL